MTEVIKERIRAVREELRESELSKEHQDGLQIAIDHAAEVANGHADKIQGITEVLLEQQLQAARQEIRLQEKIRNEVSSQMKIHIANCPMSVSSLPKSLQWIYPLRWPLVGVAAIIGFAPQAPLLITTIKDCLK